jgi:hypothetical protein
LTLRGVGVVHASVSFIYRLRLDLLQSLPMPVEELEGTVLIHPWSRVALWGLQRSAAKYIELYRIVPIVQNCTNCTRIVQIVLPHNSVKHNSVECNTYNNKYTPSSIARAWAINSAIRSPS